MNIKITINCDNAAFEPDGESVVGNEIARILLNLSNTLQQVNVVLGDSYSLFDVNGNKVGEFVAIF